MFGFSRAHSWPGGQRLKQRLWRRNAGCLAEALGAIAQMPRQGPWQEDRTWNMMDRATNLLTMGGVASNRRASHVTQRVLGKLGVFFAVAERPRAVYRRIVVTNC